MASAAIPSRMRAAVITAAVSVIALGLFVASYELYGALTGLDVIKGLRHRGGLRAQIMVGGTIRVGDPVEAELAATATKR